MLCISPVGESESDEDDVLPSQEPQTQTQTDKYAAEQTVIGGLTSTAQPVTDVGTSYDDIDEDTATSQQYAIAPNNKPSTAQRGNSPPAVGSSNANQPSISSRASDAHMHAGSSWSSDAHTQDRSGASEMQHNASFPNQATGQLAQEVEEGNQLPSALKQEGEERQQRQVQMPAGARNPGFASSALAQAEDKNQPQVQVPAATAGDPGSGNPTLASNLAFQQELQQRSGERQARAGALMGDSPRDVADRGTAASRARAGAQRGLR